VAAKVDAAGAKVPFRHIERMHRRIGPAPSLPLGVTALVLSLPSSEKDALPVGGWLDREM
jgi:hypothetical protein